MTTPRGYVLTFNQAVTQGVDYVFSPVEPFPLMVVRKTGLSFVVTHPQIPASELVVVKMPDAMTSGQPYDTLSGDYSAATRIPGGEYVMPSSLSAPVVLQLVRVDPQRAAAVRAGQHVFPMFNPEFGDLVGVMPAKPSADRFFPPATGPADFKNRNFSAQEVDSQTDVLAWAANVVDANNPATFSLTLQQATDLACRGAYFTSPFSNMSGGQSVVHGPLGNPVPWTGAPAGDPYDSGNYYSTYGGERHQELLKLFVWMMNPSVSLQDRRKLTRCFVQNIGLNIIGAVLMGQAVNEGGGHSGGFMISAYLSSLLLSSHTSVKASLDPYKTMITGPANPNRAGFGESALLYPGADGGTYYGSVHYVYMYSQANCQNAANWHYCLQHYGVFSPWSSSLGVTQAQYERARDVQRFDMRADGGYFNTGVGLFSTTVFVMLANPIVAAYVDYPPVVEWVNRVLTTGPKTYDPAYDSAIRAHLADAGGSQAQINSAIQYLISTNHSGDNFAYGTPWVKTWIRKHLGCGTAISCVP